MNWQAILEQLIGVGGAGGVLIYAAQKFADRLFRNYEHKLEKELEVHKTKLSKKNYVSKVRFDKEFEIYQELCEKVLEMTYVIGGLFPEFEELIPINQSECEKKFSEAEETYKMAHTAIHKYAAFIPEETHQLFADLRTECSHQLAYYPVFFLVDDCEENKIELQGDYNECLERSKIIDHKRRANY